MIITLILKKVRLYQQQNQHKSNQSNQDNQDHQKPVL